MSLYIPIKSSSSSSVKFIPPADLATYGLVISAVGTRDSLADLASRLFLGAFLGAVASREGCGNFWVLGTCWLWDSGVRSLGGRR